VRLRWPVAGALTGLLLVIGVTVGWSVLGHPTAVTQLHPGTVTRLAAPLTSASPSDQPVPSDPPVPVSGPGGNPLPASTLPMPIRISIPTLKVDAAVTPEGVDATGEMAIPEDIHTIGWYQWGSAPGASAGSIVMVGHVDSAKTGAGAFFPLRTIADGALITITTTDGTSHDYRVIAREQFPKTTVPLSAIFDQSGPPRLVLATCGGAFDRATGSYLDNIVVTAQPA
jgi:hypothetical protein